MCFVMVPMRTQQCFLVRGIFLGDAGRYSKGEVLAWWRLCDQLVEVCRHRHQVVTHYKKMADLTIRAQNYDEFDDDG